MGERCRVRSYDIRVQGDVRRSVREQGVTLAEWNDKQWNELEKWTKRKYDEVNNRAFALWQTASEV